MDGWCGARGNGRVQVRDAVLWWWRVWCGCPSCCCCCASGEERMVMWRGWETRDDVAAMRSRITMAAGGVVVGAGRARESKDCRHDYYFCYFCVLVGCSCFLVIIFVLSSRGLSFSCAEFVFFWLDWLLEYRRNCSLSGCSKKITVPRRRSIAVEVATGTIGHDVQLSRWRLATMYRASYRRRCDERRLCPGTVRSGVS